MQQNENYQYKFQFSLAQYCPVVQSEIQDGQQYSQHDEETVLRRSNQLIDFNCFLQSETVQVVKTLFTHFIQTYGRLAVRLFRICQNIYQNLDVSKSTFMRNFQEIIEHQRQKLVENLLQFSQIINNEKDKYFKLMSLCISAAIFKILTLEKGNQQLEFETVFHAVYWEMTGSHSTSQILKKILMETFNGNNFHKYLINQEPVKIHKATPINGFFGRNSTNLESMSFNKDSTEFVIPDSMIKSFTTQAKGKQIVSISKKISRKQKFSQENFSFYLNQNQGITIPKTQFHQTFLDGQQKFKESSNLHQLKQCQKTQQFSHFKQYKNQSNQKTVNFKKDRENIFQNFSKSKSEKRTFGELGSCNKNKTFANYLQRKLF